MFGQRLDLYGVPLGDVFPIHFAEFYACRTAVGDSSAHNACLVVWDQLGNGYDVHGRLVSADGQLLDNPGTPEDESDPYRSFAIAARPGHQEDELEPHLLSDGQSYLVVWTHRAGNGARAIQATIVGGDGSVRSKAMNPSPADGRTRSRPRVAFLDDTNEYFVVYERDARADVGGQIVGRRLLASGVLTGEEFVVAEPGGCREPDVTSAGAAGFVVAYAGDRSGKLAGVYVARAMAGRDGEVGSEVDAGSGRASCRPPRLCFPPRATEDWSSRRTGARRPVRAQTCRPGGSAATVAR